MNNKLDTTNIAADLPANTPAIRIRDLCKSYQGKPIIRNLNLTIPQGGIHALVGANGVGKTTLMRILLGFESAQSGSTEILGVDSNELTHHERGRIGFVNDDHTLPDWLQADRVVDMSRKLYVQWDEKVFQNASELFRLDLGKKVSKLSRGERAKLHLAIALAQSPEVLLLDEPSLGLDLASRRNFLEALLFVQGDRPCTILYCTHQIDEVERIADQLIVLADGAIVHHAPIDEFCERLQRWSFRGDFVQRDFHAFPSVLTYRCIDGFHTLVTFDSPSDFEQRLSEKNASQIATHPVGLEDAVIAFQSRINAPA